MGKSQNHLFALPARDLAHILSRSAIELEDLRGTRIFITGGTGFFGKWLLGGLLFANDELSLGLQVMVLSRDPAAFARRYPQLEDLPALGFIRGHAADFPLADLRTDYIIHAAADTTSSS